MVKCAWLAFLCYCPIVILIALTFGWAFPYFNSDEFSYSATGVLFKVSVLASWLGALLTALVHLFRPRKMIFPAAVFLAPFAMIILSGPLSNAAFALYIWPEASFVKKHCAPIQFLQNGRTFEFGICDLTIDPTGQISNFSFIYDSSGDIGKFDQLSKTQKADFIAAVRKYFNDDPNEPFENADFSVTYNYRGFFEILFDDANAEGFVAKVGVPPVDSKNPYSPMFW